MKGKKIHRGEAVRKAIEKSDFNISQATKRAGFSRGSYYQHVERQDLSYVIMVKYGNAIGYDFSKDFPEITEYMAALKEPVKTFSTLEEANMEYSKLRDRHMSLLEEHVALMKKYGIID